MVLCVWRSCGNTASILEVDEAGNFNFKSFEAAPQTYRTIPTHPARR